MFAWLGRSFRRRLAFAFGLTSALGITATSLVVGSAARKAFESELAASLTTTVSIINAEVDKTAFLHRDGNQLEATARFLADAAGARVTFIAPDGVVLGDSSVPPADIPKMENHAGRPEVRAALEQHAAGSSARLSHTIHQRLLYVAVPARLGNETVGVVRGAIRLDDVDRKIGRIQRHTAYVTLAVLLVTLLIALLLASSISRPVTEMSDVAARLATGDYAPRVQQAFSDEHGRLAEAMNLLADRVQAKVQELSHDKAQLSAILSNMAEAVLAVDDGGRVIAINNALSRMFNVSAADAAGKKLLEVGRHHQLDQLVHAVLSSRAPAVDEIRMFTPDERVFEAQAVPLVEDGRFAGALVVLHDITRLRRLEQVRRDFVANVSHELRTPLASIKGFAETLELGAMDDPKNRLEFIQAIQKQADRMTALVEDLLDLTAIESGQREPVRQPMSVRDLLDDVAQGLRPLAHRKKVELAVQAAAGLPAIEADRNQLRQVFVNLLENAIKFNHEGGRVDVTITLAEDLVDVRVADTGAGIPAEDLPRIFERFYRVDKARSREMGGTGLGLSIVKHIVEAHGGRVRVESTVGRGSVFTASLPRR